MVFYNSVRKAEYLTSKEKPKVLKRIFFLQGVWYFRNNLHRLAGWIEQISLAHSLTMTNTYITLCLNIVYVWCFQPLLFYLVYELRLFLVSVNFL